MADDLVVREEMERALFDAKRGPAYPEQQVEWVYRLCRAYLAVVAEREGWDE